MNSKSRKSISISEIIGKNKKNKKIFLFVLISIFFLVLGYLLVDVFSREKPLEKESTGRMNSDLLSKSVAKISVVPDFLYQGFEVTLKNGEKYTTTGPHIDAKDARELQANGVEVSFESPKTDFRALPTYLLLGILLLAASTSIFQSLGISFKSSTSKSAFRFDDVAGNVEAKIALQEVVDYLKDPKKYESMGAYFPSGLLLVGPPGVGKTLLVKATAGEANAKFIYASGSDFQSRFVAVTGMKIKSFFARARRNAPCIAFIDEMDAIGSKRLGDGSAIGREMDASLNQMLVQMDGFDPNSGVLVVAATNRVEMLDEALVRSGRFDRHIHIGIPTLSEREEILKIHGKNVNTRDFDYRAIAQGCLGMSGADLKNLMNQAGLIAVAMKSQAVTTEHGYAARNRLRLGDARPGQAASFDAETRTLLSKHEAGHTLVGMFTGNDPVTYASIIPRGKSLGQTMMTPDKERVVYEKHHLEKNILVLLGGRAAEIFSAETATTGASDDLDKASELIMRMIGSYGMYKNLLTINNYSSDLRKSQIEEEADRKLIEMLEKAVKIIDDYQDVFFLMVSILETQEEISEEKMIEMYDLLEESKKKKDKDKTLANQ